MHAVIDGPVRDEGVEFDEGALVEEEVDSVPGCTTTGGSDGLEAARSPALGQGLTSVPEVPEPRPVDALHGSNSNSRFLMCSLLEALWVLPAKVLGQVFLKVKAPAQEVVHFDHGGFWWA